MDLADFSGHKWTLWTKVDSNNSLIPKHGGYRKLKSFQIAQLVFDLSVHFCDLYIDKFSRTKDQMVQAARSGVQNIAEGSQASVLSSQLRRCRSRGGGNLEFGHNLSIYIHSQPPI